jgi:ribosomal protein S18 acetylase RimI-like enzyme
MNIRLAKSSDKDFIKKLYKQSSKEIGNFNLFWTWDKYLSGEAKHKFYVIDDMGFMRIGYSKRYNSYVLYEIAVDAECKQKGVGKKLYEKIPKPLMLKCNKDNHIGNKFYKKMGMTKSGTTKTTKGIEQNIWTAS